MTELEALAFGAGLCLGIFLTVVVYLLVTLQPGPPVDANRS